MSGKPCPRCEGIEVTSSNWSDVHICDAHMREIFSNLRAIVDASLAEDRNGLSGEAVAARASQEASPND